MKKIDFFKTAVLILLGTLVYSMFKISSAIENAKTGRFVSMGDYKILDSRTGATFRVTSSGKANIYTEVIIK